MDHRHPFLRHYHVCVERSRPKFKRDDASPGANSLARANHHWVLVQRHLRFLVQTRHYCVVADHGVEPLLVVSPNVRETFRASGTDFANLYHLAAATK